jgi:pantothenate kinase
MSNLITLERAYTDIATIGKMVMPSGLTFDTMELAWKNNQSGISCIPEGTYNLHKRESGVIKRTTHGQLDIGWEVTSVEGRTFIMIHVGNTTNDFEGCIGIGYGLGTVNGMWAILNSRKAFDDFMKEMERNEEWKLNIKTRQGGIIVNA